MRKNNILIKITIFLFVVSGFYSCMDDDSLSTTQHFKENQFILKLPEKRVVDINTRSTGDNSIQNILAAVIRSGKAEFEYVSSGITLESDSLITCTLDILGPKTGETVYFFCNVGNQSSIDASTSDELINNITCSSGTADVMYGATEIQASGYTVGLHHSMSNVEVTLGAGISSAIDGLLVCDVPAKGFASGQQYITSDVEDVPFESPYKSMFIVPRPDNNASDVTPTFLLVHLTTKGWYKLDFYKNENNIAPGTSPQLLPINSNVFYKFEISSVKNDGYTTKEEARNNVSSNIVYNLSVDKNVSTSNGQYMLLADKEEILLYPNKPGGTINISAVIPEGEIVTYKAKVFGGNIKILDSENSPVDSLDLIDGALTTGNSLRPIKFSPLGTWLQQEDDYLEITLGNIKKKIPFRFFTANSYLFDCSVNKSIKIPYFQANLDENVGGRMRINRNDNVVCELLWADQPGADFDIVDNKEAGWFEVKSKVSGFIGNVVIAAKVNEEIKWSWHLWCMDNSVIKYDDNIGLYIYKDEKVQHYCTNEWMDRNLGAFNLNDVAGPGSRGLGYQWGRKDPFNMGGQFPEFLDSKNGEGYWPEGDLYTPLGVYTMFDVVLKKNNNFPGTTISTYYDASALNGEDALEYSIKNPFVQMYQLGLDDWRADIRSDTWNASNGKKTPYDPCPIGWRVPSGTEDPNGPLYGLTLDNKVGETNYGTKWRDDNGKEIYFPYVLFRLGGLTTNKGYEVNGMKRTYNRFIYLLWGTFLTVSQTGAMTEYMNYTEFADSGIAELTSLSHHVQYVQSMSAMTVRCVRDKSIKY